MTGVIVPQAQSWTAAHPVDPWPWLGVAGGALFALLLCVAVGRALARRGRYRAVDVLGERDVEAVREALRAVERRTTGEIAVVVVERSDPHPAAGWLAALATIAVGSGLAAAWIPWGSPPGVLACQAALGVAGFLLARALPDFARRFVLEDRATAVAEEQAFQEFHRLGLHRTEARTGVLLFVSLFERRVVVLADQGIDAAVDAEAWDATDAAVLDGVAAGDLRGGLIAGLERAGALLEEHFPWREGDRNEVPDRVIVRAE